MCIEIDPPCEHYKNPDSESTLEYTSISENSSSR